MVVLLLLSTFAAPSRASTLSVQTLTNDNGYRPTWGLDIVDQRSATLNDTYTYGYTGQGVKVYVLDTGVNSTHVEFGSRVLPGYSAIDGDASTADCHGHGSHAAGVIGGTTYGVAKQVQIVPVRILNCSATGNATDVLEGINWMIGNHQAGDLAVANLSFSASGASEPLDQAIADAITAGIHVVVSAGNRNRDACLYSPGRVGDVITVGAIDRNLKKPTYSNFGSCVDVWAPGSDVVSTWYDSPTSLRSQSGTSMAAPHVSGVVALLLHEHGAMTATAMSNMIRSNATTGIISEMGAGSSDLLVHSLSTSLQSAMSTTTTSTSTTSTTTMTPDTTTSTTTTLTTSSTTSSSSTTSTTSAPPTPSGGSSGSAGSSSSSSRTTTTTSSTTTSTSTTLVLTSPPSAKSGVGISRRCRSRSLRTAGNARFRCNSRGVWVQTKIRNTSVVKGSR